MPKREPRVILFAEIERTFQLASYWFGVKWCPAVDRNNDGYSIRIVRSETRSGVNVNTTYDYFELGPDGTVNLAPRGFAKDFKPGRVDGIEDALKAYADAPAGARRINLGGF